MGREGKENKMNPVMCVLAFSGSIVAYCVIVLVISAFMSMFVNHESLTDDNLWFDLCIAQFAIVLIVLALYFANMSMGTT